VLFSMQCEPLTQPPLARLKHGYPLKRRYPCKASYVASSTSVSFHLLATSSLLPLLLLGLTISIAVALICTGGRVCAILAY